MSESEVKEEEIVENEAAEVSPRTSVLDFRLNEFLISNARCSSTMKIWAMHNWVPRRLGGNVCSARN